MTKMNMSEYMRYCDIREAQIGSARAKAESGRENFVLSTQYEPYKVIKRVYDDGSVEILYDQSKEG